MRIGVQDLTEFNVLRFKFSMAMRAAASRIRWP